jgi:hypothetical protein
MWQRKNDNTISASDLAPALSTRYCIVRTWGCAMEQMLGFFVSVVPILL